MGANWENRKSHDFYVYTLRYPDDTVFYVGKGLDKRIDNHEKEARKGVSSPKCDIIRSIWASGQEIIKQKEYEGLSQEESLRLEQEVINRHNFEYLTNKVKHGQGKWRTPEWRDSQRVKQQEAWRRRRISGLWHNKP